MLLSFISGYSGAILPDVPIMCTVVSCLLSVIICGGSSVCCCVSLCAVKRNDFIEAIGDSSHIVVTSAVVGLVAS